MSEGEERVGLVMAGGGARGAYEAGTLSVLLPLLEERGQTPTVIVGTSVGALNAVHLASNLHRGAEEAATLLAERWAELQMNDVLQPIVLHQLPQTTLRYLADVLAVPGVTLRSFLDPAPLQQTVQEWIDWPALHRNVRAGTVTAVGAVATSAADDRSVVFVESNGRGELRDGYRVSYVKTRLDEQHVRASAAIPAVFPAVQVEHPKRARGYYFDGGTRLNTPIKPAVDLGVDRVVILGTHSVDREPGGDAETEPDFVDGIVELIQGALVDPLIEDVRLLGKMNLLLAGRSDDGAGSLLPSDWREIPYAFMRPRERGSVGELALRVLNDEFSGLRRLRSLDISFIGRLAGGRSEQQGELLSFLFFHYEFTRALMELGRRDARREIEEAGGEVPWRLAPIGGWSGG